MGPGILKYHYPGNDIVNGSLDITRCDALDQIDIRAAQERISRLREAMADRRRYLEILA
jgi:hypothetical protein